MKPRIIQAIVIALVLLCSGRSYAQWEVVAPNLTGPPVSFYGVFGCMEYRDGVVWAGSICIYKSLDTGKTWVAASDTLGEVRSLTFFDKNIGAACIGAGGVYLTTNQGATWRSILDIGYSNSVVFGTTPNDIMITMHDNGAVMITRDRGRNWRQHAFGTNGFTTHAIKDKLGRIAVVVGQSQFISNMASIFVSTDFGDTWTQQSGSFDSDTWSIAADSCDPDVYYGANEEVLAFTNGISEVFMTTDVGASWKSVFGEVNLLSGSIIIGPNTVYATSQKKGVIRSTDRGVTWKNIGGPGVTFDSRAMTLINDNIILVLDTAGSIWRTLNSGGDTVSLPSPGSITLSMDRQFDDEQPFVCDLPIGRSIRVSPACNARIRNVSIAGRDEEAFRVLDFPTDPQPGDSIWLSFNTDNAGEYEAEVVIEMENGELLRLPLHATAQAPIAAVLSEIETQLNDTIGGTVLIPIKMRNNGFLPSGSLSLHYDTTVLEYSGAFSASGMPLAETLQPGHSRIKFNGSTSDSTLGYVRFEYLPLRDSCTTVTIDLIEFENSDDLCMTLADNSISANICTTIDCGTMLLSRYTRYGVLPDLTLSPNPAMSSITISSSEDVGDMILEIYDGKGLLITEHAGNITSKQGITLRVLELASGIYYARVTTEHAVRTLRFVKQ